jgi:hypothetical protein
MMQRSYGKLVLRTRKEGITISKAFFSKLLKEVRDEVLQPSVIVGSFSTCGYFPFGFSLSYAFKQIPTPPLTLEENEVVVDKIGDDETAFLAGVEMDPLTQVTPKPRSRRSPSHLFLVAPNSQPSGKQNPLGSVRQRMHALAGQATPRRVANIRNDMLHHARRATGRNATVAALVDVIRLQTEVIEGQGARHVMDTEYAGHLKGQLANRTKRKDRGTILKYGHGAMTTEVLRDLIAEQDKKEADELEAAEKRDEKKEAAKKKKEEAAAVKETRKREKAEEKERKQLADAETKRIKAAATLARTEKAQQAAVTKAKGQDMGRGGRGRGTRKSKPFPLDLVDSPVEASDGVDCIITPPVLVGRGRGTGRGRGRVVFLPALESLDENLSNENITADKRGTGDDSEDPPNSQGGSRSPPANSVSTSDNDEGTQLGAPITGITPPVGLSTTSNAATSTLPAPPEPAVVRSRSGRPIRARVRYFS